MHGIREQFGFGFERLGDGFKCSCTIAGRFFERGECRFRRRFKSADLMRGSGRLFKIHDEQFQVCRRSLAAVVAEPAGVERQTGERAIAELSSVRHGFCRVSGDSVPRLGLLEVFIRFGKRFRIRSKQAVFPQSTEVIRLIDDDPSAAEHLLGMRVDPWRGAAEPRGLLGGAPQPDGAFEQFPTLRVGFLEGGCGWVPDLAHAMHEHWEKRIRDFDPKHPYRPSLIEFTKLMIQERGTHATNVIGQAKNLFDLLWTREHDPAKIDDASLYEHADLKHRDPLEYFERGQIFVSYESDDPGPAYMPTAMGPVGERLACFSGDYGHWDGVLKDCVKDAASVIEYERSYLARLLGGNALDLYGSRLRNSLPKLSSELLAAR